MSYELKKEIINKLIEYGQDGISVNELYRKLQCGRNEFIDAKNHLIKDGIVKYAKEGKQKIILRLNPSFFGDLGLSFYRIMKRYEDHAYTALKELKKSKPLFKHTENNGELSEVANKKIAMLLRRTIDSLEAISHYTMVFIFRYYIEANTKRIDLKKNQKYGFDTIKKIIEKLISQHKDEEKEIRNYLLWGMSSSFSYVVG